MAQPLPDPGSGVLAVTLLVESGEGRMEFTLGHVICESLMSTSKTEVRSHWRHRAGDQGVGWS